MGYEVTQKGYWCFDPVHNKLYTTMDCEFFEDSYYFSQLSPPGESVGDDLSWLIYPIRMDPPEQVGNTADMPGTVQTDDVLLSNDVLNIQNRYELPPRSTRGIPLKRYSRHQHGKKKER